MFGETANRLARTLLRPLGIPAITPFALAAFRAVFGCGLLYLLRTYPPTLAERALDVRQPHSPFADKEWVYALAVNHEARVVLANVAYVAAVCFILGIFARPAYVVVVSLMFVNVLLVLARYGAHDWSLPIVTLLALIAVPWSDGPSVFQLRRSWARFAARGLASRAYGFAIWLPGLTVGLAFAAAAYAKMTLVGIDWITNGTVRYHFVEDGQQARVALGLWIATSKPLSIALSFAAVLIEAGFILVVLTRGWRTRLAFGLAGASTMAAFTLFQGVAWQPWRLLFVAFLPWALLASDSAPAPLPTARRDLTWIHATVVVALVGAQVWASARRIEVEPFVSYFPMYAYTWSSPEDFERHQGRTRYEVDGMDITGRVEATDGDDLLPRLAKQDGHGAADQAQDAKDLRDFSDRYRRTYGDLPPAIDVVVVRKPFDWQRGRYLPDARELVGTVHLAP